MMKESASASVRIAILDLYDGQANQGMRCIRAIIATWAEQHNLHVIHAEFDVRQRHELPNLDFDIYISTGGPGSPLSSEGETWENAYFGWLQMVERYNLDAAHPVKKHVFFICHSFQLACRYYQLAKVCKRKSTSFGVFPVHVLEGVSEPNFNNLSNPFYAVDSRDYQVISPNYDVIEQLGAAILCIEKERPHVPLERAIMAVRFSPYFFGTQFHPEADAIGMHMYLLKEDKKQAVIAEHGEAKWQSMILQLQDPDKILWTYDNLLPNFLSNAVLNNG